MRAFPIILLALALLAALAGWLATPRYRPPADDGEGRLRDRAVEYYRGSRRLDFGAMAKLFTPARQLTETDELHRQAAEKTDALRALGPDTARDLEFSANSITPERITLTVLGDWAVAGGTCDITLESGPTAVPLPETVWVRNAGEWWLYSMTVAELNAYGNPPDFARAKLETRTPVMVEQPAPGQ